MPPIGGALSWVNGLKGRLQEPMERLNGFPQSMQDREEFKDCSKLYNSILVAFGAFEQENMKIWEQ